MSATTATKNSKNPAVKDFVAMAKALSPEAAKKSNADAIEKIITARVALLIRQPFFGNLTTRLILVNSNEWLSTAATDGNRLYYNSEFVNFLRPKEVEFLLAHEILHVAYDHMDRAGSRDRRLYNVACDYVVNQELIDQRIGEKITSVPCLLDSKYKGMCSEEVYDLLYENAEKIDISDLADMLLDDHMDGDEEGDSDGNGDGDKDGKGNKGGRPKLSEEEKKALKDQFREAMLNAAQVSGAGNLPAGVARMIKELTQPVMNWRELLQQQIESTVKSDFSWARPSRRSWHSDAIMPGMLPGTALDIAVAIDMSGSMSNAMVADILSEVYGIVGMYDEYTINIWTFDTQVYNHQVYTQDSGDDITRYETHGGGGTSFNVNWEWMKEQGINPKKLVFFTDGYTCDGWGDDQYCDTLWVIHGGCKEVAPHGITTYYEDHKQ